MKVKYGLSSVILEIISVFLCKQLYIWTASLLHLKVYWQIFFFFFDVYILKKMEEKTHMHANYLREKGEQ